MLEGEGYEGGGGAANGIEVRARPGPRDEDLPHLPAEGGVGEVVALPVEEEFLNGAFAPVGQTET